ncbi:hypothetical protein [uncultured Dokdonia sp.]|uniref:hypothetical protein n=1 Tax=uncultured Dokdonia sp. TaxID=575653 RepID=UPI00261F3082|nr:hypothetical protein [uncultured Dokdonia sp.]
MIPSNYIEFRKKKEIGDIVTDTFKFFRRNYKLIFKILAKTAGIPFVLFLAVQVYYTSISFSSTLFNYNDPLGSFNAPEIVITALFMYLCLFLYLSFLFTGIMCIIESYIKNNGEIKEEEVLQNIRDKSTVTVLMGITKYLILIIGFIFCFIPGIYLTVPMAMVFPILIFEDKGVSESLSRAFEIIKEEWWVSFIAIVLIGLLWYLISMVFSIPMIIYTWIKMFTVMQEGSFSDPSDMFDTVTIVLTIISSSMQYIVYLIIPLGSALVYFNLNERKNQTGSLERINSIGRSDEV